MYLYSSLLERADKQNPVRVGLIGAGKFGSMFLAQVPTTPGLVVSAIADLDPDRARANCSEVGWEEARTSACEFGDDAEALIRSDAIDVVVEATGHPAAGIKHALLCCEHGKHVVMVNVEADVLAGPYLARQAQQAGIVYSMAYGDQPALTMEMIDWARSCGFRVVAAGKGTKYLPEYHYSTPDTVWSYYGLSPEQAAAAGMRSQMFNSFLDGTKSAIEMAAIANAANLRAPSQGLAFPPCGADELARVLRPRGAGGTLEFDGQVEVVSSLARNGEDVPRDLRWGVYCVFEAPNDYSAACFRQYGMNTDDSGRYSAMYKPFHLIGLELNISILSAALQGRATGSPVCFNADAVAVAKRDLAPGEILDGEGGYTVWGKLMPATASVAAGALPIGLASDIRLTRAVARDSVVTLDDVETDSGLQSWQVRARMLEQFT
ncbi:MAG: Gfo/Idh/MocA family oxidoreductase [Gammaproteobacteria bacterium]|nr:MAG: Gfo/Idh/MocA family oxidoreductase [Gammaproteobacteria bacterium]